MAFHTDIDLCRYLGFQAACLPAILGRGAFRVTFAFRDSTTSWVYLGFQAACLPAILSLSPTYPTANGGEARFA